MHITTIGLDIAKNVFQVHGIDAAKKVVVRKQLRRSKVITFFEVLRPRRRAWASLGFAPAAARLVALPTSCWVMRLVKPEIAAAWKAYCG
jgi:hypothetical protein